MRDPRLRRAFDPEDISQSVLRSFFTRLALGQYELDQPRKLIRLLEAMARNKVASQAHKAQVRRRDETDPDGIGGREPTDPSPESWRIVAGQDLLDAVRSRLTDDERLLSDRRVQGRAWSEIAVEMGSTPEALRKRLDRAMDRVAVQLDIDCSLPESRGW